MFHQLKVNDNDTKQTLNGDILVFLLPAVEVYSEPCQTSKMERFAKIVLR